LYALAMRAALGERPHLRAGFVQPLADGVTSRAGGERSLQASRS
jgi:hypothetical protein